LDIKRFHFAVALSVMQYADFQLQFTATEIAWRGLEQSMSLRTALQQ